MAVTPADRAECGQAGAAADVSRPMAENKSKRRKAERCKAANRASPDVEGEGEGISMIDRLTWPPHVLLAALLLLTGAVLRLLYLGEIPSGLYMDEASVAYEAWALLHHGITRNGYAWPVNFVAWGNGQSALYSYLSMPIIAALDLTVFSARLLQALTGTASLLLFWRVAALTQPAPGPPRGVPGATFALLALLLLTFCPWHLMLSRWALDANLLPFMVLFSVYFFTRPDHHRLGVQAAGVLVLSLSVYAYTAAYLFAPVFLASVFGWLRVQGKLPLRHFLLLSALSLLTVLPILLSLAVNFFDWEAIRAGISIPKFPGLARYEQMSIVFGDEQISMSEYEQMPSVPGYELMSLVFGDRVLAHVAQSLLYVVKLLTVIDPPAPYSYSPVLHFNKMSNFAVLFPFAIAPLAFGFGVTLYRAVTRREFGVPLLMALWLIAAFVNVSATIVNISRVNVVWLPAVYFTALGVFYACRRWRALLTVAAAAYLIHGGWFAHTYFTQYNNDRGIIDHATFHDLQPAIASVVENADPGDKIYVTEWVQDAYMLALFHAKTPPQDYLNTRIIAGPRMDIQDITAFGDFIFTPERVGEADYLILSFKPDHGVVLHPYEKEQVLAREDVVSGRCGTEYHSEFVVLHCD